MIDYEETENESRKAQRQELFQQVIRNVIPIFQRPFILSTLLQ